MRIRYKQTREQTIAVLEALLETATLRLEQEATVARALHLFRNSRVGFTDCLVAASGEAARCSHTLTFDRDAAKEIGMRLLEV